MTRSEEWVPIPGAGGAYLISNLGRVKRVAGRIMRSNGRPQFIRERILRPSSDEWGYPMVRIQQKTKKVHTLVAEAFLGPRPFPGAVIRHMDGNPSNNEVSNLQYGSASENVLDMYDYRGSLRRGQKLSETDAAKIKKEILLGRKSREIAKMFGVSEQTICDIKHGRIYRRVNV